MQSYYIMQLAFHDSFLSTKPSLPYSYTYGDRPVFEFSFLPNEISEGDTLVFAIDNDMVFYDNAPENLLHSASCMVVVRHDVTAEEATAGKVQMRIETRTVKFRDVVNGKVRPVEVISGLYRKRGSDDDINYVLLAKGRAMANGIIADYNALPEPITTDEHYTKDEIDNNLSEKADKATLVAHTGDTDIHVTMQDKTAWNSKADLNDIGNATVTITQGGTSKGSFNVNASENVTIEVNDGAQADWDETDASSPAYIQHKPSVYTQTETDALLNAKADKASVYTKTETNSKLDEKADKTSVYTKNETDGLLNEKANVATTYTKDETNSLLDGKADKTTTIAGYGITDAYTKSEVDAKVSSVYRYRGTVSTYADLPASGQEVGDVWNIETADSTHGIKAGDNVAWNGTTWDVLAGEIDLTAYATKDELSAGLEGKSDIDHLHKGKYVELNENGKIRSGYIVAGIMRAEGGFVSDEYFDADLGYRMKGVSLDNIYATKSHTHAMGDITGLPASGGTAGQVLTKTETGSEWDDLPDTNDYLCFTASQANSTVRLDKFGTPSTISLEYSTDKKTWTEYTWNDKTGATITLTNVGDSVWWRGDNTAFSLDMNNAYYFIMSGSIEASGNVMSLIDKTCKSVTIPTAYCFPMLFSLCSSLTTAPKLPATTLANWCYFGMFNACSSLTTAPELPATTLAEYCYFLMFKGCTSLTKAPDLPATTMIEHCYDAMFQGCTSLTKAPELPSTTLANLCYQNMFKGCTNINKVKVAFTSWGSNSTSSWLLEASSTGVFECPSALDCSTRNVSHVPAGWTIVRTDAPASGGTVGQVLTKTADGQEWADLPAGGGEDMTDYLCFTASQANSTVKIDKFGTTAPAINLEYSVDKKHWTEYTWDGNTGATITLVNIGDKVWWRGNNTAFSINFSNAHRFAMSGSIEASGNVMSLLDKTCKSVTIPTAYCFFALFATCASLKKAPKFPATTLTEYCYYGMFNGCKFLTEAPELPATTLAENCYRWMFNNCTSLTKAPELPATTLAENCYDSMFKGCTSLMEAPDLPATSVFDYCYSNMFNGCNKLEKIKASFSEWRIGTSVYNNYSPW